MLSAIVVGSAAGFAWGAGIGLAVALLSRDGIWPRLWATLIIGLSVLGGAIGALEWALS